MSSNLVNRDNSNCSINGANISGRVTDNSNTKVHCQSSTLNLKNNSNSKFTVTNSDVTANSCSNSTLSGDGNKIHLRDNSNSKFTVTNSDVTANSCSNSTVSGNANKIHMRDNSNTTLNGDNNEVEMTGNSNWKLSGSRGHLKFFGNSNTKVQGNENIIEAKDNSNLKIEGDGNELKIADTFNHEVSIVDLEKTTDGLPSNVFQVIPNPSGIISSIRGTTASSNSNIRFVINYMKIASISGDQYQLGIFKFKLEKSTLPSTLNLRLDAAEMDQEALTISFTGSDKCEITGSKGGNKERLYVIGPVVKQLLQEDPKLLSITFQA